MMKIAMLSPISWRTPPRDYGPWEQITSILTEGLVKKGYQVTLFATKDSKTSATLHWICPRPYSEDPKLDPKVWEALHISEVFEKAADFDLIHNHFDFLPLSYSSLVTTPVLTTIHGFSSPRILPVYKKYNNRTYYVAISDADRHPDLDYIATIHHGIPVEEYKFEEHPSNYLLFLGRIHPHKGTFEAIKVAKQTGLRLLIAGIIHHQEYFDQKVKPYLGDKIRYLGKVDTDQKKELLSKAFCLLHLINFDEPFGLTVVEAMASGTPVIALNRGSMPEIINQGRTGFLVQDVEQATECVGKLDSIHRGECRRWVKKKFSAHKMVEKYSLIYERIVNERGKLR